MENKNTNNRTIPLILFIIGEILIILAFLIIVPDFKRNNIFYLDLVVVSLVYFANANNFINLIPFNKNFESKIAGIGILWLFTYIYSIFAVVAALLPHSLNFNFQLLIQVFLLFGFAVGMYLSKTATAYLVTVKQKEQFAKESIHSLSDIILRLELTYKSKNLIWNKEEQLVSVIKEKARFLSASNNVVAKERKANIISETGNILDSLESLNPDRELILEKLKRCDNLLNERKQFYYT